jgi:hypothetical protein
MKGYKLSFETRARMSAARRGKKRPPFSAEWRYHLRIAKLGKPLGPHSEEAKRKIGLAHKGNQYRLGYKHTEETKRKIALAHLGVPSNFVPWDKGRTGVYSNAVRHRKTPTWGIKALAA